MKKFVLLYNAEPDEKPTDDVMDVWMKWFGTIGGSILDMGNPLMDGRLVNANGASSLTQENRPVSGYTIIKAEDMDAAVEIAKTCPGKSGLQVYEAMEM